MRKLSFFLAFASVLAFACGAFGHVIVDPHTHQGVISIDNVTNEFTPTQLRAGETHVVSIRYDLSLNVSENYIVGSNGFEVYSPTGADWVELAGATGPLVEAAKNRPGPLPTALSRFRKHFECLDRTIDNVSAWEQTDNFGSETADDGSSGPLSAAAYFLGTLSVPEPGETQLGGYLPGENDIAVTLTFQTLLSDGIAGNHSMCIDTNTLITAWEWPSAGVPTDVPIWDNGDGQNSDGPRCWDVYEVPNKRPLWCDDQGGQDFDNEDVDQQTGAPQLLEAEVIFNHCAQAEYTLCAFDPDDPNSGDPEVVYSFVSGYEIGELDAVSGFWKWNNTMVPAPPQSGGTEIRFLAWDSKDFTTFEFVLTATATNVGPAIVCPSGSVTISAGTSKNSTVVATDADLCPDNLFITAAIVLPVIGGDAVSVLGDVVTFSPEYTPTTEAHEVEIIVTVSDGELTDECSLFFSVIVGSSYQVEIEKVEGQLQGHFTDVFIKLHGIDKNDGFGGFDFLIAYDASALAFQLAFEGVPGDGGLYDLCGWEYFTYRFGGYGNCNGACPSGMLRVVGLAETNDGANHPNPACVSSGGKGFLDEALIPDGGIVLANLRFLVTNDRTMECQYVPIRFFWYDCGDNVLSNHDGSKALISAKVFDFYAYDDPFVGGEITGVDAFPTYLGQQGCETPVDDNERTGKIALENVDFQNGGVDIICAEDIDARGDINLNGLAYEIADAVMFTNYFIKGINAFDDCTGLEGEDLGTCQMHQEGGIAASDTNADGITLSVADLVYLIRVVIGDAAPYPKTSPVAANVTFGNDRFNVNVEMGAAHIVMRGDVQPTLLADNMDMLYSSDGQTTSILVYSTEANASFSGDFLQVNGDIVSTEFATFTGARVVAKVMPSTFVVEQNYPNPFNPTTKIDFTVPNGGDWKLGIYNVTGQLVKSFSGASESGYETVVWDASELSSGIYFYRVSTDKESVTKKAVLLK